MKNETRSPVALIQQLIAIHTTRKEVAERLGNKDLPGPVAENLRDTGAQSDRFIAALLNELSNYGDAVQADVNKTDAYNSTWRKAVGSIDAMSSGDAEQLFQSLEAHLQAFYTGLQQDADRLPSFADILQKQAAELAPAGR